MHTFLQEKTKKDFTTVPITCSRYIVGYVTNKGLVRYQVNVRGVHGGTFDRFEDASKERARILKEIGD